MGLGLGLKFNYDYENYVAYFSKRGLNKRNVLHELYHHLAYVNDWDVSERMEEREANRYVRKVMKNVKRNN